MITKWLRALLFIFFLSLAWSLARAEIVKITPLGSHAGEFCQNDRALLFEDTTGVRILYDAGRTVAGAADPRLGDVHVILLSHAHGDHIGDTKAAGLNAGTCNKPQIASATPNSNTAEIAAAKNSVVMTSRPMATFLGKKIQNIRGVATPECPAVGAPRATTVPTSTPCLAGRSSHKGREGQSGHQDQAIYRPGERPVRSCAFGKTLEFDENAKCVAGC